MKLYYMPDGSPLRNGMKIGRNEPCPCGSGKKWKKCGGASGDCRICKKHDKKKLTYQNRKTGAFVFACDDCIKENESQGVGGQS